jgi:hypothetical protein
LRADDGTLEGNPSGLARVIRRSAFPPQALPVVGIF